MALILVLNFIKDGRPLVEQDLEGQVKHLQVQMKKMEEKFDQFSKFYILIQLLIPIAIRCQFFLGGSLLLDAIVIIMLILWRNKTLKIINPRMNGGKGVQECNL
jgi:hypothetical protein